MIGFKGLIPKEALTNDAFQPITKRTEQLKRSGQLLLNFYQQIVKYQQIKYITNTKTIQQFENSQYEDSFNKNFIATFVNITNQQKYLIEVLKSSSEQSQQFCNKLFGDLGILVNKLYQSLQSYHEYQQITYQDSKKYFKIHKNMLNAIEMYKASLTDVNLIYNQDQKIKRYENCQVLYQSAYVEYRKVGQKCGELMKKKVNIRECYKILLLQCQGIIKKIAQHCIGKAQRFLSSISEQRLKIEQKIQNCEKLLQNIEFYSIMSDAFDETKLQYFDQNNNIKIYNNQLPIILLYHQFIKEQYLGIFNIEITNYFKLIQERLKNRRTQNKKILDVLSLYFKNLQKIQSPAIKDMLINFEKNRKKISESYGNRLVTFFKAITSIFQIYVSVYQRLQATISTILQQIKNNINQDAKLQKFFSQEINTNIERFTVKKQLNKAEEYQNEAQSKASDIQLIRKQIARKAQFIKHLITGFQQKIDKNSRKLINSYNKISSHLRQSSKQFYQFCNQYAQLYFGDKTFQTNLQKFYVDFESTRNKNKQTYNLLRINLISNDQTIISFQGQFAKIQDFRKLKKPGGDINWVDDNKSQISSSYNQQNCRNQSNLVKQDSNRGTLTQADKQFKNAEFLKTKITFKQNQKLIKTYSCGLAEKIVLQGKIYITNQRICFYSNFNSQNLFFGRTFIQFPKTDIKKIQKRKVSILIDNSISFTTVNGQIFFTSFFSRDEAYDLICKTFNFNIDDDVYEYDQQNQAEQLPQFLLDYEQNDDIKINQIDQRKQKIQKQLVNYPFSEAASVQIVQQGLNALKIFKIFYQDFQIIFNNKKYESYLKYYRSFLGHKDLQIQEWSPSLTTILNKSNIKQNSPLNCKRKLKMTIPVANTGVPFMPKTAKSEQTQTLYIFSKHKFILQSTVQTSGIPYADNFKVQLKTTVISNEDGKCKVTIQYFVNFVKNSMMKNVIQSKSKEETTGSSKIFVDQMKKYFQILHQKSKKKNENLPKKSVEQISNQLQNSNAQLQDLKEENKHIKTELQQIKKNGKLWKNLLISSLVLNVLIILIYIF